MCSNLKKIMVTAYESSYDQIWIKIGVTGMEFFSSKVSNFVENIDFRLVSGAGDIKITKDGNVLLHEMQIQHPTASLIARASTAQDDMTGDGTTSTVLLIGELLKQADILLCEGLHPRILTEGFDLAREKALEILDSLKIPIEVG